MPTYQVTWEIDVDAATAQEAARKSAEIQTRPDFRPAFTVGGPDGPDALIDLEAPDTHDTPQAGTEPAPAGPALSLYTVIGLHRGGELRVAAVLSGDVHPVDSESTSDGWTRIALCVSALDTDEAETMAADIAYAEEHGDEDKDR